MNRIRFFVLFMLLGVIGFSQTTNPCNPSLLQHIYHSYRLKVLEECKTVTGVVEFKRKEKDGDWHIRLKLDSGQDGLLNEKNINEQYGCLVVEIICACEVSQADAEGSCQGFFNDVKVPEVGEHILVTGSYVNDGQHGWNEIHPVTKIVVLGAANTSSKEVKSQIIAPAAPAYSNQPGQPAYLCDGSSEVYHTNPDCVGLKRCKHQIIKTTADSAAGYYHRRICKICGR